MNGLWSSRIPVALAEVREYLTVHGAPPYPVQLGGRLQESPIWAPDVNHPHDPSPYHLQYIVGGAGVPLPPCTILAFDPQVRPPLARPRSPPSVAHGSPRRPFVRPEVNWCAEPRAQTYRMGYDVHITGPCAAARVTSGLTRLHLEHTGLWAWGEGGFAGKSCPPDWGAAGLYRRSSINRSGIRRRCGRG